MAADDALIAPRGTLRILLATSYFFTDGRYSNSWSHDSGDADADFIDHEGNPDVTGLNVGLEIELGITDWISATLDWNPGWTAWSDFVAAQVDPPPTLGYENADINGIRDLTALANLELIGIRSPVLTSDNMRLIWSPGIIIPLPGADAEKELEKAWDGKEWHIDNARRAFGLSSRLSFDYVASKLFYINLANSLSYYFERNETSIYSPTEKASIAYGIEVQFEIEPHIEFPIEEGIRMRFALPVAFGMGTPIRIDGEIVDETDQYALFLRPNVAFFFHKLAVPLELEITYTVPIVGKNAPKQYIITLQITSDLKIF